MSDKQVFKSIGWGVFDLIFAIPLLFLVSYLYLFFIDIFHITDVAALLIFSIVIGIIFVKLILDAVHRRDKELKIFWTAFICAYILIMLIEIFFIPLELKIVPLGKTLSLTLLFTLIFLFYVFLMIRAIKIEREKYASRMKFWGYWVILPIAVILIFMYIVPDIVIFANKGLNVRVDEHLGISSLKELYKPDTNENGIHILDVKVLTKRPKINENKILSNWYKPIPAGVFNKKVKRYTDAYIPLLDSLSRYRFIQMVWNANKTSLVSIPNYEKITKIAKAGLISAMFDIKKKHYASAAYKIEKVWHIAKIVRSNNFISDITSLMIGEYTINLIYRGIKDGWALRKEFSHITKEIPIDIEKTPLVIPCTSEFIKGKPARLSGILMEMFSIKEEFMKKNFLLASFPIIFYPHMVSLLKVPGRLVYPTLIFNYPTMLKFVQILIPEKFSSKDEYIRYYRENDIDKKAHTFIKNARKRIISNGVFALEVLNFSHVINKEKAYIALARVLQTALEIEKEKGQTGKYPEHLEKILNDPFTGKTLIYKHLKNGYIIYSVGEDGIDNGGDVGPKTAKDIGFKKI